MVKIHTVQRIQNVKQLSSCPPPGLRHPQTSSSSPLSQPTCSLQRSVNTKTRYFMSLVCHFPEFLYLFFSSAFISRSIIIENLIVLFLKSSSMILGYVATYYLHWHNNLECLCILISEGGGHLLKCCTTFCVWLYVVDLATLLLEDFWDVSSCSSLHIMLLWYVQTL